MKFKPFEVLKEYGGTRITLGKDFDSKMLLIEKRVITEDKFVNKLFKNEIKIYQQIKHPNIAKFYGVGSDPHSFFIEYARFGTIRNFFSNNSHKVHLKNCLIQVLNAISYLHKKGFIHNDINDTNVLVFDNNRCKIVDFAISGRLGEKLFPDRPIGFMVGTQGFCLSNDVWINDVFNDIYSIGKMIYTLVTGHSVTDTFNFSDIKQPYSNIIKKCLDFTNHYKNVDDIIKDLNKHSYN